MSLPQTQTKGGTQKQSAQALAPNANAGTEDMLLSRFSPVLHVYNKAHGRLSQKKSGSQAVLGENSPLPGVDEDKGICDITKTQIYTQLYFRYVNIEKQDVVLSSST